MQKTMTPRLIPALIAIAFSGTASAAGFQLLEQNASGIGNAYAGSAAVADNASTIFFNPAGMTQLQDREFSLGVSVVDTSYQFNNNGSVTGALTADSNGGVTGFIPNGYLSWRLTDRLYVGLGIGAPFGLRTEYDDNWRGAAQSIMFDIKTINLNPSIAWKANEWMSFGFGVNYQMLKAEYVRAVSVTPGFTTTQATLKLDGDAWGWNVGALFTLSPATRVGLSYRSTMDYDLDGDVSLGGPMATLLNTLGGASSNTKASVRLPDTFILSATHKLNSQWELLGDISWTGWSSIPKIDIIRTSGIASGTTAQTLDTEFRDSWRVALGSNYQLNEAWKLKFGIAYDQTPVKNSSVRLVSLPDNDRIWFSVGAQWKPTKASALDFGVAYLYVKDPDIDNDQTSASPATNRGRVTGTYENRAMVFGAQYSMAF